MHYLAILHALSSYAPPSPAHSRQSAVGFGVVGVDLQGALGVFRGGSVVAQFGVGRRPVAVVGRVVAVQLDCLRRQRAHVSWFDP